jgi:nucleoside-diphosphate-sugar epimerase
MLGKPLRVTQDVDQPDDLMYVKDMANGVVLACFAENVEHRIFHLGVGEGITLRDSILKPVVEHKTMEDAQDKATPIDRITRGKLRFISYTDSLDIDGNGNTGDAGAMWLRGKLFLTSPTTS